MSSFLKMLTFRKCSNKKILINNLIIILLFSQIYKYVAKHYGTENEKKNFANIEDCVYFTIITHFSVGYGDIVPESKLMKRLCMLQIILVFLVFLY